MYKVIFTNKKTNLKTEYINIKKENSFIVKMKQTHSNNLIEVIKNPIHKITTIQNTDALYTKLSNIWLTVKFADCMPLVIFHPKKILSVIHAGRQGTIKKIVKKTLNTLIKEINSKEGFIIHIGPHLCKKCHEIDKENKLHYDLLQENLNQIKSVLNLEKNKLIINSECTKCHNTCFSYRGDNKTKKRNYIFCKLK